MTTARDQDLRRIETEVGVLLRRAKRVLGLRAQLIHPDLHPGTYLMLVHLVASGPMRAADLVDVFAMDKGGVSRHVQQLVDLELLERQPDPEDRRAVLLAATEEATARVRELQRSRSERFDERLEQWPDAEVTRFADLLGDYNRFLARD